MGMLVPQADLQRSIQQLEAQVENEREQRRVFAADYVVDSHS